MNLDIQIKSFIYSFVFGCGFYFLLDLFNKFTINKKLLFKIIASLFFVTIVALVYFYLLLFINNGYVHIYFLLSILVGYMSISFILSWWLTKKRKK